MQGDNVFPMPSSGSSRHVEENIAAYEISRRLSAAELQQLDAAALVVPPASGSGNGSGRTSASAAAAERPTSDAEQ